MVAHIHGIVVAFDAMHGVLLLQHRSFPTVQDLAQEIAASAADRGFWFASFTWESVAQHDRECIQKIQSMSKRREGTKGKKRKQFTCTRSVQFFWVVALSAQLSRIRNGVPIGFQLTSQRESSRFRIGEQTRSTTMVQGKKELQSSVTVEWLRKVPTTSSIHGVASQAD